MSPSVQSLDHLVLTVADTAKTVAFYERVLGMVGEQFHPADGSTRWALKFGSQKINLHQHGDEFEPKAERPSPGSADLCFLTEHPIPEWEAHFRNLGIVVEDGPIRRSGATGPILSLYIRDPDANLIEVSHPL